jgi:hypothetical protein
MVDEPGEPEGNDAVGDVTRSVDHEHFEVIDSWDDPDKPVDPTAPHPAPLGPNADPVFPSLPAGASTRPEMRDDFESTVGFEAKLLVQNVFALTSALMPVGTSGRDVPSVPGESIHPEDFDRPERDRIYGIALEFVRKHVRVIHHGFAIKTPHRHFTVGTVVISQDPVPETLLRHAHFQWAINDGVVVELRNARLPVGHLVRHGLPARDRADEGWPGAQCGLAIFLAYLFEILAITSPVPLGAVGDINFNTNAIGTVSDIDPYLEVAQSGVIKDLVLPFGNGKTSGMHNEVRYWSVRDTNEAAYSVLTHMAGATVVPNLYRRALTKQAYSWLSLILALAALLAYALAAWVDAGGEAPVGFLKVVLAIAVLFFIGSETCTHRYWKRDR